MLWHIYLRGGKVFVPVVAKTDAGFFLEVDPVIVVPSSSQNIVADAIAQVIAVGNPVIQTPSKAKLSPTVILSYAKANTWSVFEKRATLWKILKVEEGFVLKPQQRARSGGWEDVQARIKEFPSDAREIAEYLASEISARS